MLPEYYITWNLECQERINSQSNGGENFKSAVKAAKNEFGAHKRR